MPTWFRARPDKDDFPVKLPSGFLDVVRQAEDEADYGKDTDEEPDWLYDPWWWGYGRDEVVFPPIGFIPLPDWTDGDIGNGDHYGLYWPIGREDRDPVVARSSHDCGTIIPFASNLSAACRLSTLDALPLEQWGGPRHRILVPSPEIEPWAPIALAERLAIDPASPYLLVANADVALDLGDLNAAETLYHRALDVLPEYTAAQLGLVALYRRRRKTREQCAWSLAALRSPVSLSGPSFWAEDHLPDSRLNRREYRYRLLDSLQRMTPDDAGEFAADPLFEARSRLRRTTKLATTPAGEPDDFQVYLEVIEQLIAKGQAHEAVQLAMTYGELMIREGFSSLLKQGFSTESYRGLLAKTFQAAGLRRRARLLDVEVRDWPRLAGPGG